MPATYEIRNGETFKRLSKSKVASVVKLTNSSGISKEFPHEFETIDGSEITGAVLHEQANALLIAYENDPNAGLANIDIQFGTPYNIQPPVNP